MPGVKGMKRPSFSHVVRRQIWRSIRIMRRFSQPDLMRTVPAATPSNVKKYLSQLTRHGYVVKEGNFTGGRVGEFQTYRLARDTGPEHPTRCSVCGEGIAHMSCTGKEKEKEREKEKEKEAAPVVRPQGVTHDAA